ncbi:MAG: DUF1573 domain-containing protein [Cytophagaceae bacterium]
MKIKAIFVFLLCAGITLQSCNEKNSENNSAVTADVNSDSQNQENASGEKPAATQITFEEYEHDFGKIKEGEVVDYTFKFKNTGTSPLIITEAKASCGCTIPEWTKDPVAPGGEGKIEVKYNSSGKEGQISKNVTVYANTDPEVTTLTIKANVEKLNPPVSGPYKQN